MAFRLLESINAAGNDVAENVDEGASLNFLSSYKRDGRVWGAYLSISGSNKLQIGQGLIMARGYRLSIDSTTTALDWSATPFPATSGTMSVYLTITRTGHNATFSFTTAKVGSASIDQVEGSFSLLLGTLDVGPSGMNSFTDKLATISPSTGSSSSDSLGSSIATPRLAVVYDSRVNGGSGSYDGYICIANKGDYTGLASKYTVMFKLVRFVSHGQYRERSGTQKLYFAKTGWVQPAKDVGWASPFLKASAKLNELQTVAICSSGGFVYSRSDVIEKVSDVIGSNFYEVVSGVKTAITTSTLAKNIRSTRSKRVKFSNDKSVYGRHAKHNFLIFSYIACVYDGNKTVAISDIGSSVEIFPNYSDTLAGPIRTKFVVRIGTP